MLVPNRFVHFASAWQAAKTLEIRHPEMISVGRSAAHINFFMSDDPDQAKEKVREVSLMLMESVEPLSPQDQP